MQKQYGFHVLSYILALVFSCSAAIAAQTATICDAAAQYAAEKTGVPLSILRAVTLAETGRVNPQNDQFSAWPWTIQTQGKGHWFPDQRLAVDFAQKLANQGVTNMDIGCFQLNLYWHSARFQSLEDMFSPQKNAVYAATFLQELYQESGDWKTAVGQYHSRNAERAQGYVARLETLYNRYIRGGAPADAASLPPEDPGDREPKYTRFELGMARGPLINIGGQAQPLIGGM